MQFNPMDLLKNVKKLQDQMGSIQEKMEDVVVTGRSGGGMVEIDMNGRMELIAIRIEPQLLTPDNVVLLQDLIQAAFTNAVEKVREAVSSEMGHLVSDMNAALPSGESS